MLRTPDTLTALLYTSLAEAPGQPAVHLLRNRLPDETLSFAQLGQGAARYAAAYASAGLQPGEVVVLILQHGPGLIYAFWGALLQGAVPAIMPYLTEKLSPERYRLELRTLIEITRPAALVTYPEFSSEVHAALNGLGQAGPVRAVLVSDQVEAAELPSELASPAAAKWPGLARRPQDLVLLQHSSGTTGLQKGVGLSHQAVLRQLACYAEALRLAPDDVVVSWLPLYHDMGLIAGFILPIMRRVPLALMSPFDWVRAPYRLMQAVSRYRGTLTWLPNFAYNFCAQKIRDRDMDGVNLASWRAVINCSEPMRWESHQAFEQRFAAWGLKPGALATCYAMAENVFAVTQGGIDAPLKVDLIDRSALIAERVARPPQSPATGLRMLSAGKPLPNCRLRVLDEHGRDLPERAVGQLALQSDCMLTGYYNRDDLTARAFAGGWYLTGDLGYVADGEVYVTGRMKDLIIVGGKNVHPQDLEALASEVPGVHPGRVAAFGLFNDELGTEEVAIVAEVDSSDADQCAQTAEAIRLRINRGSDVAVRYVHVVGPGWVLKTSSGKVARSANRDKYLAEAAQPGARQ
jgi:fatty-acyl-CoA synthase